MTSAETIPVPAKGKDWLSQWTPEDAVFWEKTGKPLAWRTLTITTANLIMAFIVWFVVSALVVRLPAIGFKLTTTQLFWLAAMPGLAGGSLRIIHTFLVPLYGTRRVVVFSTLSLLIPAIGWYFAVQDPATPYWVLMLLAFLAGLGGGNVGTRAPRDPSGSDDRPPRRVIQSGTFIADCSSVLQIRDPAKRSPTSVTLSHR